MVVAQADTGRIVSGAEVQPLTTEQNRTVDNRLVCPLCGAEVIYNNSSASTRFDSFRHYDESDDCFCTEATSDDYRLAEELAVRTLNNRLRRVTDDPIKINVEKKIGTRSDFIIADVRVTSPIKITAEIYYKSERLGLGRRLQTLFENDYQTYCIFHIDGKHNVDRVEQHLQRLSHNRVGRFDPDTLDLTLGDPFTDKINLDQATRDTIPNYILR
jgi:hypothetical protein